MSKDSLKHFKLRCFYYIFRVFPIKKNKIVFCNYLGKGYGCNPKYIADELLSRGNNYEMIWLSNELKIEMPVGIRVVKYESIRSIFELSTAGIWIDNQRKLPFNRKRKKQYFIETWHGGGGPMKKIGADNPRNYDNKPYKETSKHMDKITNLMISNSSCCTSIYRSAFNYSGKILECGYPRNDIFFRENSNIGNEVRRYFKLPFDQKIVLYAPTYRNGRTLEHYNLDFNKLLSSLQSRFGGRWTLLMRLHPTMANKAGEAYYNENIINATVYDDMQELLYASDILISDYSSVISEFALTLKPIFLYATDVDSYAVERDFYIDYYTLPFPISENTTKLLENIFNYQEDEYISKVKEYLKAVGMKEQGTASKTVADYVDKWIRG